MAIYEHRVIPANGDIRCQQSTNQAIYNGQVQMMDLQFVGRDITEGKQLEEALCQSVENLQGILQSLDDVVWSVDAKTLQIYYLNPAAERIYQRSLTEFFEHPYLWLDVIHPKDRNQVESLTPALFSNGFLNLEYRIVRPSGEIRWLHNRMRLIPDNSAKPLRIDGIATDITERKRAQEELQASEELFRLLIAGVKDYAIYMIDKNGRIVSWNAGAERIYGFKAEEIIGQHFSCFFVADDVRQGKPVQELQQAIAKGRCEVEGWRLRGDKSPFWANAAVSPLYDELGKLRGFAKVTQDITKRKQAEELLHHRLEMENLVSSISTSFINLKSAQIDEGINRALSSLGEFAKVDRSYLFLLRDNGTKLDNTHEWCRPGIQPEIEHLQGISVEKLPWQMACFRQFQTVYVPSVVDLPVAANLDKELWQSRNVQSLLCIPLVYSETLVGFLGFDAVLTAKLWTDEDIRLLKLVGEIFVNLLERQRIEDALRESKQKYQTLFQILPIGISITDEEGNLIEANQASEEILGISSAAQNNCKQDEPPRQIIRPDGTPLPASEFACAIALQENRIVKNLEMGTVKSNGDISWLSLTAAPIPLKGYGVAIAHVDITERKQAEETLCQQAQQERLMAKISQHIRDSLNLTEILNTTVTQVREFLQCDRVLIYRFNSDSSGVIISESVGYGWSKLLGITLHDPCFRENYIQFYQQGGIRIINDIEGINFSQCNLDLLALFQVKSNLVVPIVQGDKLWGLLIAHHCAAPRQWQDLEINCLHQLAIQVGLAIQQSQLYEQLKQANQELHRLVTLDGLTQLANRRRFDEYLNQEWRRLSREQAPLALILCDVDFFKRYNDTYGHQAGDDCLKKVARAIAQSVQRPADLVARYGGEEFAVILPNTDTIGAMCVAQKIRMEVKKLQLIHRGSSANSQVTISLGITSLVPLPEYTPAVLIAAADRALYQAKEQGRDRMSIQYPIGIN